MCSKSNIFTQNNRLAIIILILHRINIALLIKHGFLMTPQNSKTYEVITFLESNSFKFPQRRGELIVQGWRQKRALLRGDSQIIYRRTIAIGA